MEMSQIIALSDEQRLNAQEHARSIVIRQVGSRPTWDQFAGQSVGKYPGWVMRVIGGLLVLVFVAAAMPSLFRLFTAGRDYFMDGINDPLQASIVGLSTFLLAEFVVILSTISAKIFFTGRARFMFVIPVCMGLVMALVGNWTVVQPHDAFSWLETIVPVATVLFVALIGEKLLLESVERQHENKRRYAIAISDYKAATSDPEAHPRYRQALANAIKREIVTLNSKGAGATARREVLASLNNDQWRYLVDRELAADEWFSVSPPAAVIAPEVVTPVNPFGSTAPIQADRGSIPMIESVSVSGFSTNGHHSNL